MKLNYLSILLCLTLLSIGCSTVAPLGLYNTAVPGTNSFAHQTINFKEGHQFEYYSFSDDLNSRKRGKGNYEIKGDQLLLSFEDFEPLKAEVITSSVFATSKLVSVEFLVVGLDQAPLEGATIVLHNKANEMIGHCFSDVKGKCSMQWALNVDKLDLTVKYTGYKDLVLTIDAASSRSLVVQMEEIGQYFENGASLMYTMKSRKSKLILKGDAKEYTFYKQYRRK